jgi:hypothetical protein
MIRLLTTSALLLLFCTSDAQDAAENANAEQIETQAAASDQENEDDHLQQNLQFLLKKPLLINTVTETALIELQLLTPRQINALIQYRMLFGVIRNRYELQAIPFWDIATIRKILPLLSFSEPADESRQLKKIITLGQQQLLLRYTNNLEKAKGYEPDSIGRKSYAGNAMHVFYRYSYQYKQQFWWGITGDKDAGERWGDFTGIHIFLRRAGLLKTIALGDYTLNIGQGLVFWQGLAFSKTSETMSVFKQGNLLQPYRSAGEWNFLRGAAIQLQQKHWELSVFGSIKKLSANITTNDNGIEGFSSLLASGYHRTRSEIADRNRLQQKTYGAVLQYLYGNFRAGISMVRQQFSLPALPEDKPYNQYAITGSNWYNAGMHHSYTTRSLFFFGEQAICKNGYAILEGMVLTLHHKVDFSLVYRNISKGYHALYGNSFTESSAVNNERGWFAGIRLAPWQGWQLNAYADYFQFPWLKYRSDAPGDGFEYFAQLTWIKRKKWSSYLRYRFTEKPENNAGLFVNEPTPVTQANLRWHVERMLNTHLVLSTRVDQVWYKKAGSKQSGTGIYLDGKYQLPSPALVLAARLQYFNTGGYASRIYSYERDLLYAFSIPAFYDKGIRYYIQLQGKPARSGARIPIKLQWWLRWAQTRFAPGHIIGSGQDITGGNKKTTVSAQLMLVW